MNKRALESIQLWLYARLICGDAVRPTGGQRVELNSAGVVRRHLEGDDRIRLLVDELGMTEEIVQRLPPDTPTPPPWSRTAGTLPSLLWERVRVRGLATMRALPLCGRREQRSSPAGRGARPG